MTRTRIRLVSCRTTKNRREKNLSGGFASWLPLLAKPTIGRGERRMSRVVSMRALAARVALSSESGSAPHRARMTEVRSAMRIKPPLASLATTYSPKS